MVRGLSDWIESASAFICGDTLQVGHRAPDAPDRCCVIQETGGGDSNFFVKDIEWLQIQIIARGKTYFNARDDARIIHNLLNGAAGLTVGTSPTFYFIGAITAVNPPQYIGQDEERRYEFSTNYRVAYYNKSGS